MCHKSLLLATLLEKDFCILTRVASPYSRLLWHRQKQLHFCKCHSLHCRIRLLQLDFCTCHSSLLSATYFAMDKKHFTFSSTSLYKMYVQKIVHSCICHSSLLSPLLFYTENSCKNNFHVFFKFQFNTSPCQKFSQNRDTHPNPGLLVMYNILSETFAFLHVSLVYTHSCFSTPLCWRRICQPNVIKAV